MAERVLLPLQNRNISLEEFAAIQQTGAAGSCSDAPITASLHGSCVWQQFHQNTTEMLVSRRGRRIFPLLAWSLSGLEQEESYYMLIEFRLVTSHRLRFVDGSWRANGTVMVQDESHQQAHYIHVHKESPQSGQAWQTTGVSLKYLKLCNKHCSPEINMVTLPPLHMYQPVLHVLKNCRNHGLEMASFAFQETKFITVTAYQNEKVTQLKILHNPFAKAFLRQNISVHAEEGYENSEHTCKHAVP